MSFGKYDIFFYDKGMDLSQNYMHTIWGVFFTAWAGLIWPLYLFFLYGVYTSKIVVVNEGEM